ncbi:MAG TPA: serine/threonine-protein kinase, partial [Kofleriaceae bacterium]|nr:serine/threonine-protein kinase [Kofleriaceae bacterium]
SGELDARFFQEARVAAHMSHPNIVRVFDFERDPTVGAYLVMELLSGRTLGALLEDGKLAPRRAIDITLQMCSGLSEAHRAGVIHRDLKPENVFLIDGDEDVVKLLDFGVAKLAEADSLVSTQPGTLVGTPLYMSPEQLDGHEVDARTDVYAAGALLFQMVTGERPYPVSSYRELVQMQERSGPRRPKDLVPELDVRLSDAIQKSIALDREQRFASAGDLAAALRATLDVTDARSTRRVAPPVKAVRPHPGVLKAAAVLLLLAGAVIGWRLTRGGGEETRPDRTFEPIAAPPERVPIRTPADEVVPAEPAPVGEVDAGVAQPAAKKKLKKKKKVDLLFSE